jgi:adenylate cyclase
VRGVVDVASGRYKEAIPVLETAFELNPKGSYILRVLSVAYAHTGRLQEARDALAKATEKWPPEMKNLRAIMYLSPDSDLKRLERLAEGYLKAGLPGGSSGFYKVSPEYKLTGDKIRNLVFGSTAAGIAFRTGNQWWIKRSKDGNATIRIQEESDSGKSWIENDMVCDQWNRLFEGLTDCWPIYRNPEGRPDKSDEYLGVPDYGFYPFSLVE